jgi:hypothetical protein
VSKALNQDEQRREWEQALIQDAVARLRASVMAIVFAITSGVGAFVATAWLVIRGGPNVGATLGLLRHYWPGYSVTWGGALVGFFYAALIGGIVGWLVAYIYNRIVSLRRNTQLGDN